MEVTFSTKLSLLWLFVTVLIGQTLLSGLMLCFGADGHIAFEGTYTGCCDRPSSMVEHQISRLVPELEYFTDANRCGPCNDVSALAIETTLVMPPEQNILAKAYSSRFANSLSLQQPLVHAVPTGLFHDIRPPSNDLTSVSLRSIVLRI